MLKYILVAVMIGWSLTSFKTPSSEQVKWMTVDEISAAWAKEPRPILVDLYTDWCGWCKKMDKVTYADARVAAYINKNYYALKYNAESKQGVQFNNRKFAYNPSFKANEFAAYLTGGQLQYPTTIFLASPGAQPAPLPGYLTPKDIEAPLHYFGEGHYQNKSFQQFSKAFKAQWSK